MKEFVLKAVSNYDEVRNTFQNFSCDERELFFKELDNLLFDEEKFHSHQVNLDEMDKLFSGLEPTILAILIQKYTQHDYLGDFFCGSDIVFEILNQHVASNRIEGVPYSKKELCPTILELNEIAAKYHFTADFCDKENIEDGDRVYINFYKNSDLMKSSPLCLEITYFPKNVVISSFNKHDFDFELEKKLKEDLYQLVLKKSKEETKLRAKFAIKEYEVFKI